MIDVLGKIQALLELSRSDNEHEAAAAASAATRLMLKYGIEYATLVTGPPPIEPRAVEGMWAGMDWFRGLADAVARHCFCEAAYWRADPIRGTPARIDVLGRPTDVAATMLLLEWLRGQICRLADTGWAIAKMSRQHSRTAWTNAFRLGCAVRVATRLAEDAASNERQVVREAVADGQTDALVRLGQYRSDVARQIEEWRREQGIIVRRENVGARRVDRDGYAAGERAGDEVGLVAPRGALPARRR